MNIVFRADASSAIGTGHVMRCLSLADMLSEKGCHIAFVYQDMPAHLREGIERKGYKAHQLPPMSTADSDDSWRWQHDAYGCIAYLRKLSSEIDWLVVDHYNLDHNWERAVKPFVGNIMVIDDLANRAHQSNVLLDQNLHREGLYDHLVPESCTQLLGPRFILLRREFRELRSRLRTRDGTVRRLLISFGGSDPENCTSKVLEAIRLLNDAPFVDVIAGGANPHRKEIERVCRQMKNTFLHFHTNQMAELMEKSDFFVGAGGTMLWERCYIGLPSITLVIADNQAAVAEAVDQFGATKNLGCAFGVTVDELAREIDTFRNNPALVRAMGERGKLLTQASDEGRGLLLEVIWGRKNAAVR